MPDGLPGPPVCVQHQPVTLRSDLFPLRQGTRSEDQFSEESLILLRRGFQAHDVFFRNDEDVNGGLGMSVPERQDVIILEDYGGGGFPAGDPAEDAFGHGEYSTAFRQPPCAFRSEVVKRESWFVDRRSQKRIPPYANRISRFASLPTPAAVSGMRSAIRCQLPSAFSLQPSAFR